MKIFQILHYLCHCSPDGHFRQALQMIWGTAGEHDDHEHGCLCFCVDCSSACVYEVWMWSLSVTVHRTNTCVIFSVWRREVSGVSAQSRWGFPINKCTESIYTGRGTWRHNTPDILFSGRVAISHTAEWSKYFQYTHAVVYYRMAKALNLAKSSVRKSFGSCCDTFPCICLLWRSSSVNTTHY